jgi:hypothetical protein
MPNHILAFLWSFVTCLVCLFAGYGVLTRVASSTWGRMKSKFLSVFGPSRPDPSRGQTVEK